MPKSAHNQILPFPVEKIYQAVLEVETYPRILPFIRAVRILEKTAESLRAQVLVGLPGLAFSYECLILFKENQSIKVQLVSGPFKRLEALWEFEAVDADHTRVAYVLNSEFKNPLMEATAGAIFARQFSHSLAAFEAHLNRS